MQEIVETKKKSVYQEEEDILMYCLDFAMYMCFFLITLTTIKEKTREEVELTERYP